MATVKTTTPMPPIHTRKHRQKLIDAGNLSRSEMVVDPVVVSPDIVSK
jgi:hypothetical protein